jgi:hypothetical protein
MKKSNLILWIDVQKNKTFIPAGIMKMKSIFGKRINGALKVLQEVRKEGYNA